MAYKKPGYSVLPYGAYIPADALALTRTTGWEANIAEAVKSIGREARPLNSIMAEDILQINTGAFPAGSEQTKTLQRLLLTLLHQAGLINRSPQIPTYSRDANLTFSEVVDRMMNDRIPWPSIEHLGGAEARLETFRTLLPIVIREIAFCTEWRKVLRNNLEEKLKDIGFKIFSHIPIDQAEKSFFLAFCAPRSRALLTAGADEPKPGAVLPAITNDRPAIQETWELYKKSVEPGPGLEYYKIISNANLESLIYYYGPHASSLPFCLGYMRPFGMFHEPFLTRLEDIAWSESDVLTALREYSGYFVHGGAELTLRGQVHWPMTTPFSLDLPAVQLYRTDEVDISQFDWSFVSTWRERPVLSTEGADPSVLLTDIAVTNTTGGRAKYDALNIDHLPLIDSSQLPKDKKIMFRDEQMIERTLMPAAAGSRSLVVKEVDMSDYYVTRGQVAYLPAFTEYVIPPRSWYFKQDPNAVQHIMSRAAGNLSNEDRKRMATAVNIVHNAENLKRLLGRSANFNIATFVANLTGNKVSDDVAAQFEPPVTNAK